jgi:hypothetical protein
MTCLRSNSWKMAELRSRGIGRELYFPVAYSCVCACAGDNNQVNNIDIVEIV